MAEIGKLKNVENDDVTVFHIAKQMRKKTKALSVKNAYEAILES